MALSVHISNDYDKNPIDAQVVQAATKWKRVALKQFGMEVGEVSVTVWPKILKDMCGKKDIHVLE